MMDDSEAVVHDLDETKCDGTNAGDWNPGVG
jgi:hypothetical protein